MAAPHTLETAFIWRTMVLTHSSIGWLHSARDMFFNACMHVYVVYIIVVWKALCIFKAPQMRCKYAFLMFWCVRCAYCVYTVQHMHTLCLFISLCFLFLWFTSLKLRHYTIKFNLQLTHWSLCCFFADELPNRLSSFTHSFIDCQLIYKSTQLEYQLATLAVKFVVVFSAEKVEKLWRNMIKFKI